MTVVASRSGTTDRLLACGLVAGPLFVVAFLLQGALKGSGYDWMRHPVSSLALGGHGWVQTANFLVSGLLTVAFAVGLWRAGPRAGGVLIGVGAGALLIAGYLWARQAGRGVVVALAAGALLLVPGWVLASSTEEMPREVPKLIANPPMTCGGEVVEVCLHQAYESQLVDGVAFAEAFYAPVAGLPGVPERVTQEFLSDPPAGTVALNASWSNTSIERVMASPMGVALMSGGIEDINASQHAILTWLVGRTGADWSIGPAAELDPAVASADAYDGYQADVEAAAARFAALPPEEQRAWLEANWDALRAGELTLEDLP